MTDLEITRLCAEKMGWNVEPDMHGCHLVLHDGAVNHGRYDPLHDDAQAMALVKKFPLLIGILSHSPRGFIVEYHDGISCPQHRQCGLDLNRAICECVAGMP